MAHNCQFNYTRMNIYTYGLSYTFITLIKSSHVHHMAFIEDYIDIFGLCAHANVVSVCFKEVCCPSKLSIMFHSLRKADISISSPSEDDSFKFYHLKVMIISPSFANYLIHLITLNLM